MSIGHLRLLHIHHNDAIEQENIRRGIADAALLFLWTE